MIVGIGVDVVDLARFERAARPHAARCATRLFAESELVSDSPRCRSARSPARFAAKEALIKALGDSTGVQLARHARRLGRPRQPALRARRRGRRASPRRAASPRLHLSMSHDAGVAIAYVVAESTERFARRGSTSSAIGANVEPCAPRSAAVPVMVVVKANGYGHGAAAVAARRARRRRDLARRRRPRRGARAARRGHRRADPVLDARPGRRLRVAVAARTSTSASTRSTQLERPRRGIGRRRAAQGRHRAQPQRHRASANGPRSFERAAELERDGRAARARASSATSPTRRAESDRAQLARFDRAVATAASRGPRAGAAFTSPRPRARSRCPRRAFDLVRVGIGMLRHLARSSTATPVRSGLAPGDGSSATAVVAVKRRAGRQRGVVRLQLRDRARDDPRAGAARLRRRHPAARLRARAGRDQRRGATP